MEGRDWLPMRRRSRKPRVVTSTHGSPRRSSSAFVATVVPIRMHWMRLVSSGWPFGCGSPVTWAAED